jgi:MtfA peptidase
MSLNDTTIVLQNGNQPGNFDSLPVDVQQAIQQTSDSLRIVTQENEKAQAINDSIRVTWEAIFIVTIFALGMLVAKGFFARLKESNRQKFILFFTVAICLLIIGIYNDQRIFTGALFISIFIGVAKVIQLAGYDPDDIMEVEQTAPSQTEDEGSQKVLRYEGSQLDFSVPAIHATLNKHWPYFSMLEPFDKDKFGMRLKKFIESKTYEIYDDSGFVEMPILISAAAIQITFGLEEYLLPDFPVINIFPDGFFKANPYPRFLEGNVSDGCINLSWKHFLMGIQCYTDGSNVGLHEMAHALYCQSVLTEAHKNPDFCKAYTEFNDFGTKVFQEGKTPDDNLYNDYAFKNIQEFWAVSVELFFEEPVALKNQFPLVYNAIVDVLNQDPANKFTSVK